MFLAAHDAQQEEICWLMCAGFFFSLVHEALNGGSWVDHSCCVFIAF